uniref:Transcription elongation factor GreA n=1 Tax=candidate division CPR3 bacterium TaxID=2268181 RepID=A0A7C4R9Y4_UNCC3
MNKEVFLTKEKLEELKKELEDLKKNARPEIIARIKEARALGDLSENAEYHSAREEQGRTEGRIEELEYMIKNAKIIDKTCKVKNKVDMGCKVTCSIEGDGNVDFTIVGSAEVDVFNGKISNESPIGKSLMGKKVGDVIEFDAPAGKTKYKILKIS